MNLKVIIEDIQQGISLLQSRLDELKVLDTQSSCDILLTRKESASLLKVSVRQIDRYCKDYKIHKITTINGVRISKRELLVRMKLIDDTEYNKMSDFERIVNRSF